MKIRTTTEILLNDDDARFFDQMENFFTDLAGCNYPELSKIGEEMLASYDHIQSFTTEEDIFDDIPIAASIDDTAFPYYNGENVTTEQELF